MCYTIGVTAHNEEQTLPAMLTTLYGQLETTPHQFQVVVVCNGCTDRTTEVTIAYGMTYGTQLGFEQFDTANWWHFALGHHMLSVCKVSMARKSLALNLIHQAAAGDIILLFDADIRLAPNVIDSMVLTFRVAPDCFAVGVRYQGEIPPIRSRWSPLEWLRILVSRAINHFDDCLPRIDGKGYGYRRSLIQDHPSIIAVDTWLEACAWRLGRCIYLKETTVFYRFPETFQDLVVQYARYVRSFRTLIEDYPWIGALHQNRGIRLSGVVWRRPRVIYRILGLLLFSIVDLYLYLVKSEARGEQWTPIQSTKRA